MLVFEFSNSKVSFTFLVKFLHCFFKHRGLGNKIEMFFLVVSIQ